MKIAENVHLIRKEFYVTPEASINTLLGSPRELYKIKDY